MIAPRLEITHRGSSYPIYQLGEAWVIEVERATYFLTAGIDPMRQARVFVGRIPVNSIWERGPGILASERFPLVVSINGLIIRAWPKVVTRDDPPRTFFHPHWAHRVAATKDESAWVFSSIGRPTSAAGTATAQQTINDLTDMATIWLRDE